MRSNSIAIIPARGGSKRIPRKNIKYFMGRPLIAWSIDAAKNSGCFSRIIVSTDDEEVASVALREGAEVPFLRPAELSDDFTPTVPVIRHALQWCERNLSSHEYSAACCIYPTAPLLDFNDIAIARELLIEGGVNFVVPITDFGYSIQRALQLNSDDQLEMREPNHYVSRSQDLNEYWHDSGQFYWGWKEAWFNHDRILDTGSCGYKIPRYRVQDIDTEEDWTRAEVLFRMLKGLE